MSGPSQGGVPGLVRDSGLDADAAASAVGGAWIRRPSPESILLGAAIDSRTVLRGNLFFAFAGEHVDGHDYVASAARAGAGAVVVERDVTAEGPDWAHTGVLRVGSTRAAMRDLAWAYRRSLDGLRVVAVTGSNGKTTTVRLVHAALRGGGLTGTHATRSHNNELGVPLTILNARPTDEYLICEVGMNAPGEIMPLAELAAPDIGVITSIGRAHLERLGSLAGIAEEKADLVRAISPNGVAVVTGDSPELDSALERGVSCRVVRVGVEERTTGPGRVGGFEPTAGGCSFGFDARTIRIPMTGLHNAGNAGMAYAVAREMGCEPDGVIAGLAEAIPPEMRQEIVDLPIVGEDGVAGTIRIINDAYNANPESVRAALSMLGSGGFDPSDAAAGRRSAILGDMLEMGDAADSVHREIVDAVRDCDGIGIGLFVGPAYRGVLETVTDTRLSSLGGGDGGNDGQIEMQSEYWIPEAAHRLRPGDVVLLKGSRGMRLERLLVALGGDTVPAGPVSTR